MARAPAPKNATTAHSTSLSADMGSILAQISSLSWDAAPRPAAYGPARRSVRQELTLDHNTSRLGFITLRKGNRQQPVFGACGSLVLVDARRQLEDPDEAAIGNLAHQMLTRTRGFFRSLAFDTQHVVTDF